MPDQITRKRLKKKVLDRWENEGGKIIAAPTGADENAPASGHESEGSQLSASHDNPTVATTPPRTKKRKPTQK